MQEANKQMECSFAKCIMLQEWRRELKEDSLTAEQRRAIEEAISKVEAYNV